MHRFQIPVHYIRENFEEQDRLGIVLIDRATRSVQQKLLRAAEIMSDRFQSYLRAKNAEGKDVYLSMNTLSPEAQGRTKSDVAQIRHVYLDIDEGGREVLNRVLGSRGMPEPHHVLQTSPDKFQVVWRVEGFEKPQAEQLLCGMAAAHGADPAATDCSRVLRIPGFRNWKYEEPHYVKDVHEPTTNRRIYNPDDFPSYPKPEHLVASSAYEKRERTGNRSGGSQSERDFAYVRRALERGESPNDLIAKVARFRPDKSNPHYYATRTVERALQAHFRKATTRSTPSIHSEGAEIEPIR